MEENEKSNNQTGKQVKYVKNSHQKGRQSKFELKNVQTQLGRWNEADGS